MDSSIDLPAISSFLKKSTARATTSGTIEKASVMQGDYVKAGQLLFSIRTKESAAMGNSAGKDSILSFRGLIDIKSPGPGVVTSVKYQPGDFVQEGDELAIVAEQNSLVFILQVPVEVQTYVERSRSCRVDLPDSKVVDGKITGRLPEMNLETQTLQYIIQPSEPLKIPENLIGNVSIVTSSKNDALVLPKKAVLSNETQNLFWIMRLINDSTAVKTYIQKGMENDKEIEVIQPQLLPSDRIVLTGNYGLPDTAKVAIIKE